MTIGDVLKKREERELTGNKRFKKYLSKRVHNVEEAKQFYKKWLNEKDQELPFYIPMVFTCRAMAHYLSNHLEGKEFPTGLLTSYLESKYGSEIYLG